MDDCANAQYPPITAAIRSRVESGWDPWPEAREWLLGKCDTIDAIHAQLERDYQRACDVNERQEMEYTQLKVERDQARADCAVAEGESIRLADEVSRLKEQKEHHDFAPESHYVMLPKDADGVPWHIGDVTENGVVVHAMELNARGWIFLCQNDIDPSIHYHQPPDTWERIIEDACGGTCSEQDLVARCKALAGDAE